MIFLTIPVRIILTFAENKPNVLLKMNIASKDEMLRYFNTGRNMPELKCEEEEKLFLQLQRYNLIEVNPQGKLIMTKRGNDALSYGVEKYLTLERYEKRLITDGFRTKTAGNLIAWVIVPLVLAVIILSAIQLLYPN